MRKILFVVTAATLMACGKTEATKTDSATATPAATPAGGSPSDTVKITADTTAHKPVEAAK